jgi:deoxyribonuclease IV
MIKIGFSGTAGIDFESVFYQADKFNLDAIEIPFTYGVNITEDRAKKISHLAKKLNLDLSVHAPYFINLAAKETDKIIASKKRILASCYMGNILGATHIVFHAGFYLKRDSNEVYDIIKFHLKEIQDEIISQGWKLNLAPETTGKATQFGTLNELISLSKEVNISLCIDFAHLLARDNFIDYDKVLNSLTDFKHIHCHFSGIEYTIKGERRHLLTEEEDIKILLSKLVKNNFSATIINESPMPFNDALKTKSILMSLI